MLASNELPGFKGAKPSVSTTASAWLAARQTPSAQVASETKRLTRLGFVAGAAEDFTGPSGRAALSLVEQFKTPGAARSELANQLKLFRTIAPGYQSFPVPGIPGAHGYAASGPALNIAFASGPYYYLVGEFVSAVNTRSEATLIAAAKHLYQSAHG